ncbi:MAG: amidohydrolase [Vicinamibacterales bacterium]
MSHVTRHAAGVAVAGVVLAAGLACGPRAEPPADLVVVDGRVYPAGGATVMHEALAVRGDRIVAIGTNAEIAALRGPATRVVDAAGRAVVPGFNDTHLHLFEGGAAAERADLSGAATVDEVQARLREFAAANPAKPWVLGEGWRYNTFPDGLPTRAQLDAVVADRPAFLRCFDYHTTWVNSKALQLAGITRDTPDPVNGRIVRDPRTGEPTGVLQESAQGLVSKLVPAPTADERLALLDAVTAKLHAAGVTSIQNALGSADEFAAYDRARRDGRLALRVYSAVSPAGLFSSDPPPPITAAMVDEWDTLRGRYADDPSFRLGMVKLFVDGVIETHTAKLLAPYANLASDGPSNYTAEELTRVVTLLDRRGWQVMMHAVGDGAVRMALDAVEATAAVNPAPARGRRHRIDHIETLDPADEPRFAALNVVASMHPGGIYRAPTPRPAGERPRTPTASVWGTNLGPERAARGGGWQRIVAAGGRLTLGSDWPVASYDPSGRLYQVAAAAPREGRPDGRLAVTSAIDAYTSQAAYLEFEEGRKGTLASGQLADVVVLASDVFGATPTAPADFAAAITVFGGRVVYERR